MKVSGSVLLQVITVCTLFSVVLAADRPVDRGRALFNDPKFSGGSRACSSCHPDGQGLETAGAKAASKKLMMTPAGSARTLEEAVNICIVNANGGKAIGAESVQMKDIIAYIKSLGKKAESGMPKKKGPGGS